MAHVIGGTRAPGGPGIEPRWTRGAKQAVGTAYSTSSRVWFTVSAGILTETYFPTIDRPQIRDCQLLFTDGKTFFLDERHLHVHGMAPLADEALGVRIVAKDPQGRFGLEKEIIADPHQPCVLQRIRLTGDPAVLHGLKVFALLAPHLEGGGWHNSAAVAEAGGREFLAASRNGTWAALAASAPFPRRSCGFVGVNDGWRDLDENLALDWSYDAAEDGNVALTGELALDETGGTTIALGFGFTLAGSATAVFESLAVPFVELRDRFLDQWRRACRHVPPLADRAGDGGRLFHASHSLLLAHEDKTYPGAFIASLSIPWGEAKGDRELGGYHLVWTRDLVHSATALLAAGNLETPRRALVYLAAVQRADGGFDQNFWINGDSYWRGVQLDEAAFPVILAWRLEAAGALKDFDPWPFVARAAGFLVRNAPVTPQERWEENSGYSPSTLAAVVAALACAADLATRRGAAAAAACLTTYAASLADRIEGWTVTTRGTLLPGVARHYLRLCPADPDDPAPSADPDTAVLVLKNQPAGEPAAFPAREIVDAGFLELVRYGLRRPGDPLIEDSLRVVDAVLRRDTPHGPAWRRYPHDGYGQRADGGPFDGAGVGRAWPLLAGERGHYELAAGRDPGPFLRALEGFATAFGLLPEQVWDEPDRPLARLKLGRPTGAACPLLWAHAEYVTLMRSARDGRVFDLLPPAEALRDRPRPPRAVAVWKFNDRPARVSPGGRLVFMVGAPCRVRWTTDEWRTIREDDASDTGLGVWTAAVDVPAMGRAPVRFTFFWPSADRWEGRDFLVEVLP